MTSFYVVYLTVRDDCSVQFSEPIYSFSAAKEGIATFLNSYAERMSKKLVFLSEDELEKLKVNKRPEDCFFVRQRTTEATLYRRNTFAGTFYNTYSIEKFGEVSIQEFTISSAVKENIKAKGIETRSHGVHVTFISELKDKIANRGNPVCEKEIGSLWKPDNKFVTDLVERKKTLKQVL